MNLYLFRLKLYYKKVINLKLIPERRLFLIFSDYLSQKNLFKSYILILRVLFHYLRKLNLKILIKFVWVDKNTSKLEVPNIFINLFVCILWKKSDFFQSFLQIATVEKFILIFFGNDFKGYLIFIRLFWFLEILFWKKLPISFAFCPSVIGHSKSPLRQIFFRFRICCWFQISIQRLYLRENQFKLVLKGH